MFLLAEDGMQGIYVLTRTRFNWLFSRGAMMEARLYAGAAAEPAWKGCWCLPHSVEVSQAASTRAGRGRVIDYIREADTESRTEMIQRLFGMYQMERYVLFRILSVGRLIDLAEA